MDTVVTVFGNMLQDSNTMLMGLLVFLATGTLAFSVMAAIRVRGSVKRRTSRILTDEERKANHARSLQHSSQKTVGRPVSTIRAGSLSFSLHARLWRSGSRLQSSCFCRL